MLETIKLVGGEPYKTGSSKFYRDANRLIEHIRNVTDKDPREIVQLALYCLSRLTGAVSSGAANQDIVERIPQGVNPLLANILADGQLKNGFG